MLLLPSLKELNNEIYVKYGNNIFLLLLFLPRSLEFSVLTEQKSETLFALLLYVSSHVLREVEGEKGIRIRKGSRS